MNNDKKIVTRTPLDSLWSEQEELMVRRERYLNKVTLREMLDKYPVEFVIADVGSKLKWISIDKCFDFWKSEVQQHLVDDPTKTFYLKNYPGEYAYVASEWTGQIQTPIILLEKQH